MRRRNPNTECSVCKCKYYRSPCNFKFRAICKDCRKKENESTWVTTTCPGCKKEFKYARSDNHREPRVCCSRACANVNRTGSKYPKGGFNSKQKRRLYDIINKYNVTSCMVEGCNYNKTYDVHRLVPGKEGGKYEFGNMFTICPNHHAEYHRGICKLEKINDYTLKAIYGAVGESGIPSVLKTAVSD